MSILSPFNVLENSPCAIQIFFFFEKSYSFPKTYIKSNSGFKTSFLESNALQSHHLLICIIQNVLCNVVMLILKMSVYNSC